jgi:hypothetical protein
MDALAWWLLVGFGAQPWLLIALGVLPLLFVMR